MKLYQKFTHPSMFRAAALKRTPGAEGELLDLLTEVTQSDIDDFRSGIDPLAEGYHLVLSTCWPFDALTSGPERYLVHASLIISGQVAD